MRLRPSKELLFFVHSSAQYSDVIICFARVVPLPTHLVGACGSPPRLSFTILRFETFRRDFPSPTPLLRHHEKDQHSAIASPSQPPQTEGPTLIYIAMAPGKAVPDNHVHTPAYVNFTTAGMGGCLAWVAIHPFNTIAVRSNLSFASGEFAVVHIHLLNQPFLFSLSLPLL